MKRFVTRGLFLAWTLCLLPGCNTEETRQGMVAALAHAIQETRKIQPQIAATRKCPNTLEGWQRDRSGIFLETKAGTPKVRYVLSFDCTEPGLKFGIVVKYSFDSGPWVLGSPTGALTIEHGHFTAPIKMEFRSGEDATAVADRIVRASYMP